EVGYDKLLYDDQIGKVSLIGAGMPSHPGITARFFAALASAGVNIEMISTSEIRISVIVDETQVDAAVQATHTAFDLDADEVEDVVYVTHGRGPPSGSSAPPGRWASRCARSSWSGPSPPTRSASS